MSATHPLDPTTKTVTTLTLIIGVILLALTLIKCEKSPFNANEKTINAITEARNFRNTPTTSKNLEVSLPVNHAQNNHASLTEKLQSQEELIKKLRSALTKAERRAHPTVSALPQDAAISENRHDLQVAQELLAQEKGKTLQLQEKHKQLTTDLNSSKRKIGTLFTQRDAIVLQSDKKIKALTKEVEHLTESLKSGESSSVTQRALSENNDTWKKKFDDFSVSHELKKAKETNQLHAQINKLKASLRQEKSKKVFANNVSELAPAAQALITSLESFGPNKNNLTALYKGIRQKDLGSLKAVIPFSSGSATIALEQEQKIQTFLNSSSHDSYYIAVGYADTMGNAEKNKSLSSKRATSVVNTIKPLLKETQFAQAFYLGQTDRFGDPAKNRVVEIWEVK